MQVLFGRLQINYEGVDIFTNTGSVNNEDQQLYIILINIILNYISKCTEKRLEGYASNHWYLWMILEFGIIQIICNDYELTSCSKNY